jgi:hypothetical protein
LQHRVEQYIVALPDNGVPQIRQGPCAVRVVRLMRSGPGDADVSARRLLRCEGNPMGLWIVIMLAGLPILLKMFDAASKRRCKSCGTDVRREAPLCPSCGSNPKAKPQPRQGWDQYAGQYQPMGQYQQPGQGQYLSQPPMPPAPPAPPSPPRW